MLVSRGSGVIVEGCIDVRARGPKPIPFVDHWIHAEYARVWKKCCAKLLGDGLVKPKILLTADENRYQKQTMGLMEARVRIMKFDAYQTISDRLSRNLRVGVKDIPSIGEECHAAIQQKWTGWWRFVAAIRPNEIIEKDTKMLKEPMAHIRPERKITFKLQTIRLHPTLSRILLDHLLTVPDQNHKRSLEKIDHLGWICSAEMFMV